MRKLYIIGIGAGDPEHVTMQAIRAMNAVDVFFFLDKGESKSDLVKLRQEICERYVSRPYRVVEAVDPVRDPSIESYTERVEAWHRQRALLYEAFISEELGEEDCGAILVWGDPSLYDSTLRIVEKVIARGKVSFDYEVIPGITSLQSLAARHKIVLNGIGESVSITTGRQLAANGLPPETENSVIMLDGNNSFKHLLGQNLSIYWGAYLGTEKEILLSGKLDDIAETIEATRREARQRHGWIMDIYMLTRPAVSNHR
ncbi:precorrin-6A synthase [Silvibacterium bohemicum]|uniref:Precorrin-6A synthase n=1 Tax=Silvibacterium bohemicum TaxID=1577686 RepID=A0A841JW14_9BACT|nr:precorrin-6A synthase (deacetylating) [Silvibacterium bohemicum]MBB6145340.1 precorrin-6A synthase [Silvibacterium bohemicum]